MQDYKMQQALRASELIVKHIKEDLTDEEQAELNAWLSEKPENLRLFNELTNPAYMRQQLDELEKVDVQAAQRRLQQELFPAPRVFPTIWRYAAAAMLIVTIGASLFWLWKRNLATHDDKPIFTQRTPADVLPGSKKARLVLADGRVMELDGSDSSFTTESGTLVTNSKGTLSYKGATGDNEVAYHTIIVPRAGEYTLWLDDGTRVWLNSASSLHYPAKFTGKDRTVKLTGEGYFQVAEDKARPFHVSVNNLDVKVTGTEFNINSYADEAVVRSTLFKGAVHVTGDKISFDLKPGQQLQTGVNGVAKIVNADLEATAAWKNGVFHMSGADVPTIMRQIARWYDLEQVVYPANFDTQSIHISGTFPKSAKLDEVLEVLSANGARFRLDNKKLIMLSQK